MTAGLAGWAPALLGALIVAALAIPALVTRFGRGVLGVAALLPAGIAVWCAALIPAVAGRGEEAAVRHEWIPSLGLSLDLRLDVLSLVMCLVVSVVGAGVLAYSVRYFPPRDDGLAKFGGSLLAFIAAMLGLVLADNLILLVVCWELTGILSYLLIAHRVRKLSSRRAAAQALMVTTAGGVTLLVGAVLLGVTAGTFTLSEILAHPGDGAATAVAVALMLVGGVSKSAIVPFHFWLPGAMAAPTPASAYLHAATMVKAGIYLFARLAPAFAALPWWRPSLMVLGAVTLVVGALYALRQTDLKLLLAYGTVSQLGLMTLLLGAGSPAAVLAGLAVLIAHATFKSALFFVVGILDVSCGTRDLRRLSGVGRHRPVLAALATAAALSMAGLPPMIGFVAKDAGYAALLASGSLGAVAAGAMFLGAVLTVAYSARFLWGAFATKSGVNDTSVSRPMWWMSAPTAVLVLAGLLLGLWPQPVDRLLSAAPGAPAHTLALWHGWTLPLGMTLAALAGGLAVFAGQRRRERVKGRLTGPGREAGAGYRAIAAAVDVAALRITLGTQRGSLPVSLGAIVGVLVVFVGTVLAGARLTVGDVVLTASLPQGVLMLAVAGLGLAVLRIRQAIGAVLAVGGVGYLIAVYYVLRGAPDLALTQMLVETVTLVAAVLVLMRMPRGAMLAHPSGRAARVVRISLACAVGALMAALALIIPGQRRARPVFEGLLDQVAETGGGDNVVNVILVDVRGWDTFGEISVLAAAAIGVSSLIFLRNPRTSPKRVGGAEPGVGRSASPWLVTNEVPRQSLLLEVATRLIFHMMIIFSVYVLFVGHDEPGGGFAAGLIAGIALALRYLAGGRAELGEAAPVDAGVAMGIGLALAAGSALAGPIAGRAALTNLVWSADLGAAGHWSFSVATLFDIGVYLVVVGMVLEVLRSLGGELDRQAVTDDAADDDDAADGEAVDDGAPTHAGAPEALPEASR